jgi:hypothetical protein
MLHTPPWSCEQEPSDGGPANRAPADSSAQDAPDSICWIEVACGLAEALSPCLIAIKAVSTSPTNPSFMNLETSVVLFIEFPIMCVVTANGQ